MNISKGKLFWYVLAHTVIILLFMGPAAITIMGLIAIAISVIHTVWGLFL